MRVEQLDQLGEVGKRPRQPVDLVDDDHVDLPRPDVVQLLLDRRPLHRPARKSEAFIGATSNDTAGLWHAGWSKRSKGPARPALLFE